MTTPFYDYRKAHDEMEADNKIQRLKAYLDKYLKVLADLERPYTERMHEAGIKIKELVLEEQKTVVLHGVRGKYRQGRKTTSWKGVAEALDPSEELVAWHTKMSAPSVAVSIEK